MKYPQQLSFHCTLSLVLMTLAGTPATTVFGGTSFVTTLPAPNVTLSPIVTSPMTITFAPNITLSPMVGNMLSYYPIVVHCMTVKFLPMVPAPKVVANA